MSLKPTLKLYSRQDCHLCEDMRQQLHEWQETTQFQLLIIDVDSDPELNCCYGERVPVLTSEEGELCHFFLDGVALEAYLGSIA